MDIFSIFFAQFLSIFLLGVQSLMVRDNNVLGAVIGSFIVGYVQFYVMAIIAQLGLENMYTAQFYAFLIAGPSAIFCSIKLHPYINKHIFRRRQC